MSQKATKHISKRVDAREEALLAALPKPPSLTTTTTTQPPLPLTPSPLQLPIPPTLNPIDPPPADPTNIQDYEQFYDTEIDDELELPSTSQVSGTKVLQDKLPEGEINSKKSRNTAPPTIL